MTRWIFLGFLIIVGTLLASMARLQEKNDDIPYFLRYDSLAANSNPIIELEVISTQVPTEEQLEKLKQDYAAIWAHLNQLYQYPNPKPSKERFTERFYLHLAKNYQEGISGSIQRKDISHSIQIQTWSRDGLSCNILDQSAEFNLTFPDGSTETQTFKIALSLLFQGDNWRLDAIRFID
ncbi:hypothetical protein [Algoriphagus halophilus]|uniref:DUF3828 domain-containing protein n=1 Tax=Algoriphagus halophilus TaxID=226505 RepID=A0A1N6D5Q2_9BACT|nr:hypothetical protein [Algoriphagus halophilus]SIN66105.1 hypothetical protein SAMN05444394_0275 [Algoriphagus halophilus]